MPLCLAAGIVAATLAVDSFTLAWTHSIEKQRWEDPAFVAAEARRRLHFVLPGEVGYVTLGSEESLTADGQPVGPDQPWYSALWGAVQEVDDSDASPADSDTAGLSRSGTPAPGDGE